MIALRLKGESVRNIGKKVGRHGTSVWKTLEKADLKNLIEKKQLEFIENNVDKSLEGVTDLIHAPRQLLESDDKKMQYDAWMKTAQAIGVYPSNQTSVVVQRLTNINIFQQPQLKEAMGNFVKYLAGPADEKEEVIDAETVGSNPG